jgi:hypothetical protein
MTRGEGYDELWNWFGMSRASWLTMPRTFMHEMPDEWQAKMAVLLNEWDKTWDTSNLPSPHVQLKANGKFVKTPEFLIAYRHPNIGKINFYKVNGAK